MYYDWVIITQTDGSEWTGLATMKPRCRGTPENDRILSATRFHLSSLYSPLINFIVWVCPRTDMTIHTDFAAGERWTSRHRA